ncbi:hypothetical protein [Arthrobacter sp. Ld5]|uniref:hypothetical protein n=1 Tax=Arthrobacter sp. Ld5 TaxID=649152 RepID=UPI003EBA2107
MADSLIRVSLFEPVAVIRRRGAPDRVVTWADLPIGRINPTIQVTAASGGAWVLYTPATADEVMERDGTSSRVGSTAIHISPSGDVVRFLDLMNVHLLGSTRHGLWLWSGHWDVNTTADWLRVRELLVLDAGGATNPTSIDRMPLMAFDDGSSPHLVVYASAPEELLDAYGGTEHTYRCLQIDLPAGDLPAALRIGAQPSTPIEATSIPGWSEDAAPATYPLAAGDPRARWDLVDLPAEQREAAVDAVCAEFADLDAYWRTPAGNTSPLADGVTDTRVDIIGRWPETRVEVSFAHPHFPQGRLRRTYRVFDDAGRVRSVHYAAIHLMEDLDTGALPPVGNPRNAVLDI